MAITAAGDLSGEILPIVAIIFCVLAFYLYIQRLELPHIPDDTVEAPEPIPETRVTATTLPFQISLLSGAEGLSSMKDGVLISVQTATQCSLQGFWVVECARLSEILQLFKRLGQLRTDFPYIEERLREISRSLSTKHYLASDDTRVIHLKMRDEGLPLNSRGSNEEVETDLGPIPRTKYPLVVYMNQGHNGGCRAESSSENVTSMLWIIHLPDKSVSRPGHVISQVIITRQGQVFDLQKMFLASDSWGADLPPDNRHRESCSEEHQRSNTIGCSENTLRDESGRARLGAEDIGINGDDWAVLHAGKSCTVCQNAPISRAIIPCRHACVCEHCLGLLFACPMCRGAIASHFRIRASGPGSLNSDDAGRGTSDSSVTEDWTMRIQTVLEKFNDWFGFH